MVRLNRGIVVVVVVVVVVLVFTVFGFFLKTIFPFFGNNHN